MTFFKTRWIGILALCICVCCCSLVLDSNAPDTEENIDWLFYFGGSLIGFLFFFSCQMGLDSFLKRIGVGERVYSFYIGFFAYGGFIAAILALLLRWIGEEGPFLPMVLAGSGSVVATLVIVINEAEKEAPPET